MYALRKIWNKKTQDPRNIVHFFMSDCPLDNDFFQRLQKCPRSYKVADVVWQETIPVIDINLTQATRTKQLKMTSYNIS